MQQIGCKLKGPFIFYEEEAAGGILGGGAPQKKLKGGPSKKIREKGRSRRILSLLERGGRGINFSCLGGGVMQPSNDTSKNSTRPRTS